MKIAIDCSLVPGARGGIGQYSYNLAHALARVDTENTYSEYILFPAINHILHPEYKKVDLPDTGNFRVVFRTIPVHFQLMRYLWLPGMPGSLREYMLGGLGADLYHSHTYCVPRFRDKKKRLVVTVYDVSVLTHPECHTRTNRDFCLRGIKDAVRHADGIIAISEHTKADLIDYFNAPPELITVTHLAASSAYREIKDPAALQAAAKKYALPENYILFVGSLEPRKNVRTLLKAYSLLPERLKKEFSLVVAGGKGWLNSDIPASAKELKISERVKFAGYIEDPDIAAVYSGAAVFAYPSLYEGFGLPILEAMSCGTPVVTSDTSSMPEVAGGAAALVSPHSAEGIAAALSRVLERAEVRREMKEKGLKRAALFSWDKCARETLAVYRKVVESGRR